MWLALDRDGVRVAHCMVERLMKVLGLHSARRGRTLRTARSDPVAPRPADLVDRNVNPSRPDALWVADFSSRADLGRVFTYVAFVIDAFRQRSSATLCRGPNWIGVLPLGAGCMTAGQFLPQVRSQVDR